MLFYIVRSENSLLNVDELLFYPKHSLFFKKRRLTIILEKDAKAVVINGSNRFLSADPYSRVWTLRELMLCVCHSPQFGHLKVIISLSKTCGYILVSFIKDFLFYGILLTIYFSGHFILSSFGKHEFIEILEVQQCLRLL